MRTPIFVIIVILLIISLAGSPRLGWGYYPAGGLGGLLLLLLILVLLGVL